jgi:hypothetical protein
MLSIRLLREVIFGGWFSSRDEKLLRHYFWILDFALGGLLCQEKARGTSAGRSPSAGRSCSRSQPDAAANRRGDRTLRGHKAGEC